MPYISQDLSMLAHTRTVRRRKLLIALYTVLAHYTAAVASVSRDFARIMLRRKFERIERTFERLSRGQISNFEFCLRPRGRKNGYYFQSGTCLGASETHVLLSFLWSIFCKWPVINVTLLILEIAVHKIQD